MAEGFAFGEFAFSSFRSSHPLATLDSRSNCLAPVADDDEWGDFVKSPQQSQFADPPINSFTGKGNSPLAPTSRWVKPSGALPLSFFGAAEEVEEQEGKDAADFNLGRSNVTAANFNSVFTENSKNLSAGNLFSHTSQINGENGPDSNPADRFDLNKKDSVLVENGFHSNSDLNVARSDSTDLKNININGAVGRSDQSQLTRNGNSEFSFEVNVFDPNHKYDLFGAWSLDLNESSSNSNSANPNVKTSYPNSDMNYHTRGLTARAPSPPDADDADDDDGWEFQDAYSEPNTVDLSNKVDFTPHDVSAMNTFSPGSVSCSNEIRNLFEPAKESIDLFAASTRFVDTFAASTAGSHGSQDVELISSTQPSKASKYDSSIKENDAEGILNPSPDVESSDFDEDFGEFTAASAETKPEQRKDASSNFYRSALPMSIFGNEEPESDGFLDAQDAFVHQSNSESDNHTSNPVISINDLISSLYNQTEKTSLNTAQEPNTVELNLSSSMTSSNLGNDGDHLDDTSWDFKDAFSQRSGDNDASLYSFGDAHLRTSSKMKLNNHLDFYCKLKEALCFVSKNHIEQLKQSQGNDTLLGEDSSISDLTNEFQMLCKELEQMDYLFDNQDHASNNSYLSEFIEILLEPQFHILESEYHLSEQLLLVEKDLKSAMELIRHTNSMLKILTLGTSEEKTTYISVWSNIISVCAQELKEGASIWTKAAEKHVQSQLLAKTQGRNFVLELGEIYRVVVILEASAKLFKPWTISCSIDLSGIYILLEECHTLWSTSGLEEALNSVHPCTSEDALLFKSIKDIRGLDATVLQNYVFMEEYSLCGLSMLSAGVAPGVKIIKWGEERYFVTIANLWVNLISCTPPKLPRLRFGS